MYAFQKVGLIQRESYLPLEYLKGRIIKKGGFIGGEGIHPGYGLPILVGIFVPKSMKSMHIFARLQQESGTVWSICSIPSGVPSLPQSISGPLCSEEAS